MVSWRTLGTSFILGTDAILPALDSRNATFSSPLSAANTAGLNPAIRTLLLGNVTLAPRDVAPGNTGTNTTFSTSAQRGLRALSLSTTVVPAAALALPALINLTLAAPAPKQQLRLAAGSLDGLPMLNCINCAGTVGLANLSGLFIGALMTQPPNLPLITTLDASATGIMAVYEHDFDGMRALRWLSLAGNNNLTFVSDAAFSAAKQPALATMDQSRTPLTSGSGCRPGTYAPYQLTPAAAMLYVACSACPTGASCADGSSAPIECGANSFSTGGLAACTPCPTGAYAPSAATECIVCSPGIAAPGCNATASWRDTITIVADGAGSWAGANIYLLPAGLQPPAANVSCGQLTAVSTNMVSCAVAFMLPASTSVPVLTTVWVVHAGTGGVPQRLNTTVILVPPPPLVLAPGGGLGLAPLMPGSGRLMLRLPAPRLTAADWSAMACSAPTQIGRTPRRCRASRVPPTPPTWLLWYYCAEGSLTSAACCHRCCGPPRCCQLVRAWFCCRLHR